METEVFRFITGVGAAVLVGWINHERMKSEKLADRVALLERKNDVMQATLMRLDTIASQFQQIQVEITKLTSEVKHLNRNIAGHSHGMDN